MAASKPWNGTYILPFSNWDSSVSHLALRLRRKSIMWSMSGRTPISMLRMKTVRLKPNRFTVNMGVFWSKNSDAAATRKLAAKCF